MKTELQHCDVANSRHVTDPFSVSSTVNHGLAFVAAGPLTVLHNYGLLVRVGRHFLLIVNACLRYSFYNLLPFFLGWENLRALLKRLFHCIFFFY